MRTQQFDVIMNWRTRFTVVAALVSVPVFFALFIVRIPTTSTAQFQVDAHVGEVAGKIEVGQWFESVRPNLSGVTFQFATYSNRQNTEEVIFALRRTPSGDALRTVRVSARRFRDHQRYTFAFPPLRDSQGATYVAVVRSPASHPGNAITVEYSRRDPYQKPGPSAMFLSRTGRPHTPAAAEQSLKPQADLAFGVVHDVSGWERLRILVSDIVRAVRTEPQRWFLDARFGLAAIILAAVLWFSTVFRSDVLQRATVSPYLVAVLLLAGFGVRLIFARHLPYTNDEGSALYDAWTLLHGRLPGGDGVLKAPVFLGVLALGLKFFGVDILTGRLVSIVASVLTALPLMRLSRNTGVPTTSLTTASIWLLIAVPAIFGIYTHAQPVALLFGVLSLAVWASALQARPPLGRSSLVRCVLSGACLALALGARKTAVAFAVPASVLVLITPRPWRERVTLVLASALGFLAIFGPLLFVEYRLYGGAGLRYFVGVDVAAIDPATTASPEERRSALIKGVLPIFREGLPLLLLAGIGVGGALEALGRRLAGDWRRGAFVARLGWVVPVALAWFGGGFLRAYERSEHFAYGLWPFWVVLAGTFVVLAVLPRRTDAGHAEVANRVFPALLLVGLWLGATTYLYTSWIKFTANYLAEFLPPLALLAAFGASWARGALRSRRAVAVLLAALTAWGAFASLRSGYTFPHTGTFALSSLREAAGVLRGQAPPDALVLTGAVAIPVLSGHRVPFDVAHPTHYAYGFIEPHVRNVYMAPAESMVREVLQNVRWVVHERLTAFSYFREYPEIERHVEERFEPVAEIENLSNPISILRRREEPWSAR